MPRQRAAIGVMGLMAIAMVAFDESASASVPNLLTEQGRLLDTSGAPLTGTATIVFTIYDAATNGTALWTETQSLSLDGGYFSARLGEVTPIPGTVLTGAERHLGVAVNGDTEMTPRQTLDSVPYALVADNAIGDITPTTVTVGGVTVISAAGQWVGPSAGIAGPTGAAGPAGAVGPAGAMGATGLPGPAGPTGIQGPAGPTGPTGPSGAPGVAGPTGPAGATGATGVPGAVGPTGPSGAAGPRGVMASGASGAFGAIAGGNYNFPLTAVNVSSSTQCSVSSQLLYANPSSGPVYLEVAYQSGGITGTLGQEAYLPAEIPGSGFSSTSVTTILNVTPNTVYNFGCWFATPAAANEVYCRASVVCF